MLLGRALANKPTTALSGARKVHGVWIWGVWIWGKRQSFMSVGRSRPYALRWTKKGGATLMDLPSRAVNPMRKKSEEKWGSLPRARVAESAPESDDCNSDKTERVLHLCRSDGYRMANQVLADA
eukprot:5722407-Pleurochrysis_carterae.AAC.1